MKPTDLARLVLRYVGSSWTRASILAVLSTWTFLLVILYQNQQEILHALGIA